jgi:rubrerythrin
MDKDLQEAIAMAAKMETDGMAFYEEASEKVASPLGKLMFKSFIEDEKNHLEVLNRLLGGMFDLSLDDAFKGTASTRFKTIFEENRSVLDRDIKAGTEDIEAVEVAMDMEEKGAEHYSRAAEMASDEKLKRFFDHMAAEERWHYAILEKTLAGLVESGNWERFEAHGIMDG